MTKTYSKAKTACWKRLKYSLPAVLLGTLIWFGVMVSGLEVVKSRNFSLQCGAQYMDGTSEMEVLIDGEKYTGIQRVEKCDLTTSSSASEVVMIVRPDNMSYIGLSLDGEVIQSELTVELLAGFGVFLMLFLAWFAAVKFSNLYEKV